MTHTLNTTKRRESARDHISESAVSYQYLLQICLEEILTLFKIVTLGHRVSLGKANVAIKNRGIHKYENGCLPSMMIEKFISKTEQTNVR